MTKYIILHGTDATPDDNWFMWLKGRLIGKGDKVWLPQLPGANKPDATAYNKFLLSNKNFKIDSDTVIVGHSSGAVEILNLLDRLPKKTVIKAAILVSAFKDNLEASNVEGLFKKPFDFENIKTHSKKFILIHSDDDPYVPLDHAVYLSGALGGDLHIITEQGHFNEEMGPEYKQFPELFEIIETIDAEKAPFETISGN